MTPKGTVNHDQLPLFDPGPLIDKHAAARRLSVKPRFIERLIAEHRITYIKVGRHVRIRTTTIDNYLRTHTINARTDNP